MRTDYKPGIILWIISFNPLDEFNKVDSSIILILKLREHRYRQNYNKSPVYFAILQKTIQFRYSIQEVHKTLSNKYLLSAFYHMVLY